MSSEVKKEKIVRAPIVAVMGHIDHGKSTLIDYIRKTKVAEQEAGRRHAEAGFGLAEAGGITQHVSAYEILYTGEDKKERRITFLDTPGHEAFEGIRRRGANTADIAVLVVSAEDGVKPQTLEARDRILESKLPFIIAITKIDKPSADEERTKQSLAENALYVEGYGGNIPCVPLSSKTGQGVNELLEMISLVADLEKFESDNSALGSGVIIESELNPRRGVTSVCVVKNGKVFKGLFAASEGTVAPLRFILDCTGRQVEEIEAGRPVQIVGWTNPPQIGAEFKTFLKKEEAEEYAEQSKGKTLNTDSQGLALKEEDLTLENGETMRLSLIIKADTSGSLEAVAYEVNKLSRERIKPKIINSGIGTINENDIKAAIASSAVIIGFGVKVDIRAKALAERAEISVFTFEIIYELMDKVSGILEEKEPHIEVEEAVGTIKVLKIFSVAKDKQVLGGRVLQGEIKRGGNLKIMRRESEIGKGKIKELQQSRMAVESVQEGNEFGMMVESKIEIAPGDILEVYLKVTK
ncbi:MAG: translation initiation factor IF-2 [Patescibacteria group bacterium]